MKTSDSNPSQFPMDPMDPEDYASLIMELIPTDCDCGYCFLKFYLSHCHPDRRMLIQLKCIEKFKWERSEQNSQNCGWQAAIMAWADEGYAKAFADCYSPVLHIDDIYARCKAIVNAHANQGGRDLESS